MSRPFEAILLDPYALAFFDELSLSEIKSLTPERKNSLKRCIESVTVQPGLQPLYNALSSPQHKVSTIEAAPFYPILNKRTEDVLYVDEEGLLTENHGWILIKGAWQPFCGRGLAVGTTARGHSCAPKNVSLQWCINNVVLAYRNIVYYPKHGRVRFYPYDAVYVWNEQQAWNHYHPMWAMSE